MQCSCNVHGMLMHFGRQYLPWGLKTQRDGEKALSFLLQGMKHGISVDAKLGLRRRRRRRGKLIQRGASNIQLQSKDETTQVCYRHPEERKGKSLATDLPNCNKNSKRRRTLRERELEKWRLSQSDCTAIPTATVFIPALAIAGNFRSFPDFSRFTFPSSKAWLSQPKKAGNGLCCRDSRVLV